jgi:RP/EB family microtubule-associated protein
MSKVKFNVSGDYAYIQNFKILQSTYLPLPKNLPP